MIKGGLELLEWLQQSRTPEALFAKLNEYAQQLGFEYACYGAQAPLPLSNPRVDIFESYPKGWIKHYREQEFLKIDPTIRLGRAFPRPIVWNKETFSSAPSMWSEVQDFGMATGISHSSWGSCGVFGILSFARSADKISDAELVDLTERMSWLTSVAHTLMVQFLSERTNLKSANALTLREKEVLRWTAEGKTALEIGMILGITERTVNFHINNVLAKLDVSNKIQATVRATLLGVI